MATLKKQLGDIIAKPKMGQEEKVTASKMPNTRGTLFAPKTPQKQAASAMASKQQSPVLRGAAGNRNIPISDVTGNRELASQPVKARTGGGVGGMIRGVPRTDPSGKPDKGQGNTHAKDPYIPISVVTGSRDITTVSPELRAFLLKGSPSATTAMPEEYAELANLLNKTGSTIDFKDWADKTAKQQLTIAQRAGLSAKDQQALLNASPHYVETVAKVQDVFANRYTLGITLADARNAAKELFEIANERNEAITRTGKYENDAVFAPKALQWLEEKEKKILDNLTKNASETDVDTVYTGGNPDLAARAARRATYADIDQAVASEQIEELIMKNVEEAKKVAFASGANKFISLPTLLLSFYLNTKKNAPMDYKNPIIWNKALPGLPYPEEDQIYNVFGIDISSSDLGNLNYALVGKALGIPEWLLLQQAGAAQLRDHNDQGFFESQYKSLQDDDYGDEAQDQGMIKMGFDVYSLLD